MPAQSSRPKRKTRGSQQNQITPRFGSRADQRYAPGVYVLAFLLSRGLVVLATRMVERRVRRRRDDDAGDGRGDGGRGGRGGDGADLVLAA
jgi:hypothetical protein